MLVIILGKLWQKKWMNLSILVGCVLLIAIAVSFPLYRTAAYDRMLQDVMADELSQGGNWPMIISMKSVCERDKSGRIERMEGYTSQIYDVTGVDEYETVLFYYLLRSELTSTVRRDDAEDMTLALAAMSDLKDHARMIAGEPYSDTGIAPDGAIEVMVSQATLTEKGLLLGEELTFKKLADADGKPVTIRIVGIYTGERVSDFYFQQEPEEMYATCMMEPELFRSMFTGENAARYNITVQFYDLLDYRGITSADVEHIMEATNWICEESPYRKLVKEPSYSEVLKEYELKKNRITSTLIILQIPVLVLLAAFLLMLSGQMYEMERGEISVIKSRGSSRGQILLLYLYQGIFLTVIAALLGLPLGALFAGLLGSTRTFLSFDTGEFLQVAYTKEAFIYAGVAMLITIACISIPAIRHSRLSVVGLKREQTVRKRALWERLFLDIVLIGVSLYGYNISRDRLENVSETVLTGGRMDPLMYISSSLFIVGMGLLFLRLQPYFVRLLYLCVGRFCSPAGYISFMENIRNGRRMHLIMLFLIMTMALGIFHTTVARTIMENAVDNTEYLSGADVILKEQWSMSVGANGESTGVYMEPDPDKYIGMDFAKSYTKVLYDRAAYIRKSRNDRTPVLLMGIHTREFGELTTLAAGLNPESYHTYLNLLAGQEDGVLLSRSFETIQGMKVGDTIDYHTGANRDVSGKVMGFFDLFPTYIPQSTVINPDGTAETSDNYMIVANLSWIRKRQGTQPYEIWIALKDGATSADVYDFISSHDMRLTRYVNRESDMKRTVTDPLLQGTNGVLTLGFVVTLLLCAVGYIIYQIMSVKERELVFGVLRASGLHRGELLRMLLYDQIFTGILSVLAGIGIGRLTAAMYVPMVQVSYATSDQVLPVRLITMAQDMYRLYGFVAVVMAVSVAVLILLLLSMNVTGALKIGEE